MKTINFDKLRIARLRNSARAKNSADPGRASLATTNSYIAVQPIAGAPPPSVVQFVVANLNVHNALNNINVLNNSNVNVSVTLADVLNANGFPMGRVAGVDVSRGGVVTVIVR